MAINGNKKKMYLQLHEIFELSKPGLKDLCSKANDADTVVLKIDKSINKKRSTKKINSKQRNRDNLTKKIKRIAG